MHLTNYAVNKHNENFVPNDDDGGGGGDGDGASKLGLAQLEEILAEEGLDWQPVWEGIQQLIIKSLISVQPVLRNNYRRWVARLS
jgi:tubulin polyglutamylase TTLL6/13